MAVTYQVLVGGRGREGEEDEDKGGKVEEDERWGGRRGRVGKKRVG